jgi:hypothetical protein
MYAHIFQYCCNVWMKDVAVGSTNGWREWNKWLRNSDTISAEKRPFRGLEGRWPVRPKHVASITKKDKWIVADVSHRQHKSKLQSQIRRKCEQIIWTEPNWIRIQCSGRLLVSQCWSFEFRLHRISLKICLYPNYVQYRLYLQDRLETVQQFRMKGI